MGHAPTRKLTLPRFFSFGLGVATSAMGLAMTVSMLSVMYAEGAAGTAAPGPKQVAVYLEEVRNSASSREALAERVTQIEGLPTVRRPQPIAQSDAREAVPARAIGDAYGVPERQAAVAGFTIVPAASRQTLADRVTPLEGLPMVRRPQPIAQSDAREAVLANAIGDAYGVSWKQTAIAGVTTVLPESAEESIARLHAFGVIAAPAPFAVAPIGVTEAVLPVPPPRSESPLPPAASVPASAQATAVPRPQEGLPVLRRINNVSVTFYDCAKQGFCGRMANGRKVYEGAAACSYDLPLGTRFYIHGDPTGRVYRCEDRGLLSNTWVDIFWYHPADGWDWQAEVGRHGTIDVVEWGTGDWD